MGVQGNERADKLARMSSATPLNGPEPAVGIASCQVKIEIRRWLRNQHRILYQLSGGMRQTKAFIAGLNKKLASRLSELGKRDLRMVVGLLTGHCHLNRHRRIGDVHSARRQLPVIFGTSGRRVAPDRNLIF